MEENSELNSFEVLLLIRKQILKEMIDTANEIKFLQKVEYVGGILLISLLIISWTYFIISNLL